MPAATIDENEKLLSLAKKCLLFAILAHILAAWFSIGYVSYDEHFQVLEFAMYKLGIAHARGMAWELPAQIRPALQPAFVVLLFRLAGSHADPFVIIFILHLFSSLLGMGSLAFIVYIALKWLNSYQAKRFLILSATLLWFFPYLHSHFTAENISGSLFFLGAGCIFIAKEKSKYYLLLLGGFLLGLSFVCRYQAAFMVFGLMIWAVFVARFSFLKFILIAMPAMLAIALGVILDHWFYGDWVSTAWNYYKINLIMGKAASFGVSPWWAYFKWAGIDFIPPFSIAIIAGILYSFYKYPKNIIVLSSIPFIVAHLIISHKEPRFMYPLMNGIPVLLAFAYSQAQNIFSRAEKYRQWVFTLFWGANLAYMAVYCLRPASNNVMPFSTIYHQCNGKPTILISFEKNPYVGVLFMTYYEPQGLRVYDSIKPSQADSIASTFNGQVLVLSDDKVHYGEFVKTHPGAKVIYSGLPLWLYYFNFNNWLSRTSMYKVYVLKP